MCYVFYGHLSLFKESTPVQEVHMSSMMKQAMIIGLMGMSGQVFAFGVGQVVYPMGEKKNILSAEANGVVSSGGGVGAQVRYTHRVFPQLAFEAGLGTNGGERANRVFLGADYEILPDYYNQPRVSLKANYKNAKEFDQRINGLSIAPIVSKGFNFWGWEAYPFASLPLGVELNQKTKNYNSTVAVAAGVTSAVPFEGYQNVTMGFEAQVDLKDTFTAITFSLGFPLNL
jgi:hypothetical protein